MLLYKCSFCNKTSLNLNGEEISNGWIVIVRGSRNINHPFNRHYCSSKCLREDPNGPAKETND